MNYGMVLRVIGNLIVFEAFSMVTALAVAFYYKSSDIYAFVNTIMIMLIVGYPLSKFKVKNKDMKHKEAISIVTFGWFVVSAFGALPFMFTGALPSFTDAFFETVSGLTTTGASVLTDIESLPRGLMFWRSFLHWTGGMGILVLTLAIMPTIGVGAFQIFKAETPGPVADKLVPKMKDTARILYTVYLGITVIQVTLLMVGGMSFYDALVNTFGTVGTGGFSNYNASIGHYQNHYFYFVIGFFMVASGVNFSLYYELYRGRVKTIFSNIEFKVYIGIVIAATLLVFFNILGRYESIPATLNQAFFQVSSIITTTGYATTDFDLWPDFSKGILFLLMFVGASAGSTGGSIKVIRLIILFKLVKREVLKILHPRATIPVQINGKMLNTDVISGVTGFFFLYMLLFVGGTLLVSLENVGLVSAASAVAATLGNIGPGLDFVGPTKNYSLFSDATKWLLSFMMLFGRLELFTFFIVMTPSYWKKV
ncbi:MAG: TrkH family potassium uptake protein [Firmicutes bacterium]|nr:TrkH family potassium uptake protein [Bacillota bacterium]